MICKDCAAEFEGGSRRKYCDGCLAVRRQTAVRKWAKANPNTRERREVKSAWYQANKKSVQIRNKKWRADNPDYFLLRNYGITEAQREQLILDQNGACAVCQTDLDTLGAKHTHTDHCHTSGVVRGVLCVQCNTGLGSFRDSLRVLKAAITYLRKHA